MMKATVKMEELVKILEDLEEFEEIDELVEATMEEIDGLEMLGAECEQIEEDLFRVTASNIPDMKIHRMAGYTPDEKRTIYNSDIHWNSNYHIISVDGYCDGEIEALMADPFLDRDDEDEMEDLERQIEILKARDLDRWDDTTIEYWDDYNIIFK